MKNSGIFRLITRYNFELTLVVVQFLVCGVAGLSLLAFFAPPQINAQINRPGSHHQTHPPKQYRIVKLPEIKPQPQQLQVDKNRAETSGIYITVTEIQSTSDNSADVQVDKQLPQSEDAAVLQIAWPKSPELKQPTSLPVATETPLVGLPTNGQLSQRFGCSPYYTGIPGPGCSTEEPWFHDGIDIATWKGSPVQSTLNGTVVFAGPDGDGPSCGEYRGYGLGVVVDSGDGWQALYAHLSDIQVTVGQTVTPDTFIGAVGDTGCVTGEHLHFGLRHNDKLVDPINYLKKR